MVLSKSTEAAAPRPRIGVTGPTRGGTPMWLFTWLAVYRAGGWAVRITPDRPIDPSTLHGLILGGGADVSPTRYGEPRHTATRGGAGAAPAAYWDYLVYVVTWVVRTLLSRRTHTGLDIPRDEMEMRLLRYALERRLPVLGICRGEQLLNVFFGGSLYQELTGYYEEDPEIRTLLPRKAIQVVPHSQLAKILGSWPMRVNALHRQAVAALGRGIAVSARDRNGIVQAIEHQPSRFVIGVQWHPEFLPHIPRQRVLFRELIRAARGDKPIGVTDYTESGSARSEG